MGVINCSKCGRPITGLLVEIHDENENVTGNLCEYCYYGKEPVESNLGYWIPNYICSKCGKTSANPDPECQHCHTVMYSIGG